MIFPPKLKTFFTFFAIFDTSIWLTNTTKIKIQANQVDQVNDKYIRKKTVVSYAISIFSLFLDKGRAKLLRSSSRIVLLNHSCSEEESSLSEEKSSLSEEVSCMCLLKADPLPPFDVEGSADVESVASSGQKSK